VEDCAAVKVGVERHGKNIWRRDSVVAPGDWQWHGSVGCSLPPPRVAADTFLELFAASVADG
jgi:hypothetical protein